jgi:hypothetical protein
MLKKNAEIRGWLTVLSTDVASPKFKKSGRLPLYCSMVRYNKKTYSVHLYITAKTMVAKFK